MRQCPVAHNSRYGGFWVVSGYDEVVAVSRDGATFSSKYEEDSPDGIEYIGIMGVPRMPGVPSAKIAEVEGPTHVALRRLLNPFMLPSAVAEYRPFVEQCATWLLDQKIADGDDGHGQRLHQPGAGHPHHEDGRPALRELDVLRRGVPRRQRLRDGHRGVHPRPDHDGRDDQRAPAGGRGAPARARARTSSPSWSRSKIEDGRHLRDDELIGVLWNLIGGGSGHDDVAHVALPVPPRRASRSAPAPHRGARAADPGHRGVPPLHLGQRDAEPHGDQGRRVGRPAAQAGRLPHPELALRQLRREGLRPPRRGDPRPHPQPAHGLRRRPAPLHRHAHRPLPLRGDDARGARPGFPTTWSTARRPGSTRATRSWPAWSPCR